MVLINGAGGGIPDTSKYFIVDYSDTDSSTILNDILSDTGFIVGTVGTSPPIVTIRFVHEDRLRALQRLADASGWEIKVNDDDTVDFQSQIGIDRSASLTLEVGVNAFELEHEVNIDNFANRIIAAGGGQDAYGYLVIREDTTSQSNYTLIEKYVTFPEVKDYSTLANLAEAYLAEFANPTKKLTLRCYDLPNEVEPGDIVRVIDNELGIDDTYRILSLRRRFDSNGEVIDLELDKAANIRFAAKLRTMSLDEIFERWQSHTLRLKEYRQSLRAMTFVVSRVGTGDSRKIQDVIDWVV